MITRVIQPRRRDYLGEYDVNLVSPFAAADSEDFIGSFSSAVLTRYHRVNVVPNYRSYSATTENHV